MVMPITISMGRIIWSIVFAQGISQGFTVKHKNHQYLTASTLQLIYSMSHRHPHKHFFFQVSNALSFNHYHTVLLKDK